MKKYILLVAISSSFIMCKKGEATSSAVSDVMSSADSAVANSSSTINDVSNEANTVLDSANIKIKDFQKTGISVKQQMEETGKNLDSLSQALAHAELKSKNEDKDSLDKKEKQVVVNVAAPKVIKETKIIYKDRAKTITPEIAISDKLMKKSGVLELNVNDAETAKEIVTNQVKKYDGIVKSENLSTSSDNRQTAYLKIKVPIQKFDYLMEDLSNTVGSVENKGIDIFGDKYENNTLCDIDITLYGDNSLLAGNEPQNFGSKSLSAISSGWNVITSIFLFLLPLWPLYLIAGIGYYFYKKKNVKNTPS